MNQQYKYFFLIICFISIKPSYGFAQDTIIETFVMNKKVVWVGEFPLKTHVEKTTFSKKLLNVILGKKPIVLKKPISLVSDNNNTLFVADQGLNALIKVKNNSGEIPKIFSKVKWDFLSLVGITLFYDNKVLFTDSHLNAVFLYNEENNELSILNETLKLAQPTGIAYSDVTKEIWVVETAKHRISILNDKGELIRRIGKRGKNLGEFNFPTFIWIDKLGTIYVIDSLNFRVQIFDKSGKVINVFGEMGDGSGNFARPKGVAVDSYGNIYIADALFHVVQIFDKSGNFLYSFGKQGREKEQFWMPTGIFIDEKDNIYVADSYNSRIQIFQLISERKHED